MMIMGCYICACIPKSHVRMYLFILFKNQVALRQIFQSYLRPLLTFCLLLLASFTAQCKQQIAVCSNPAGIV